MWIFFAVAIILGGIFDMLVVLTVLVLGGFDTFSGRFLSLQA